MNKDILAIVVPCFNEEEVFATTAIQLTKVVENLVQKNKISSESYILFVNDGSKDRTWDLISEENSRNKYVYGVKLAGNVGHQNALVAGLMTAKKTADITVSIDADLQDDINIIETMVDKYHEEFDIVYGVRNNRDTDSFFKRTTALGFYKLMNILGVKSVYNHADFRLMSKRAIEQLGEFDERNLFLRGIVPLIGYNTTSVYYKRGKREAGESKYPLKKMLAFAFDGITSFSIKPINMIAALGFFILGASLIAIIYTIIFHFSGGYTVDGWSSLIISIWFLGGVQLLSIGIVGGYIGKVYVEVKKRPRYNIETILSGEKSDKL
jgi:glycosyltransferase involved in cell wall biosynthesis